MQGHNLVRPRGSVVEAWKSHLQLAVKRDSFSDGRNDAGIDPPRGVEKYFCFRHFAVNFYYALVVAPVGRANYRTHSENLGLTTRRVTPLHEAVVVIERYFDECLHLAELSSPGGKSQLEITNG